MLYVDGGWWRTAEGGDGQLVVVLVCSMKEGGVVGEACCQSPQAGAKL